MRISINAAVPVFTIKHSPLNHNVLFEGSIPQFHLPISTTHWNVAKCNNCAEF